VVNDAREVAKIIGQDDDSLTFYRNNGVVKDSYFQKATTDPLLVKSGEGIGYINTNINVDRTMPMMHTETSALLRDIRLNTDSLSNRGGSGLLSVILGDDSIIKAKVPIFTPLPKWDLNDIIWKPHADEAIPKVVLPGFDIVIPKSQTLSPSLYETDWLSSIIDSGCWG